MVAYCMSADDRDGSQMEPPPWQQSSCLVRHRPLTHLTNVSGEPYSSVLPA